MIAGPEPHSELRAIVWRYHMEGQHEYYWDLAQAFEQANPGHRVVIEFGDWNTAQNKIAPWITDGDGPDLTIGLDV